MRMVIKNLLIDITGVLYESGFNRPIKGSIEAIQKLSKSSISFGFLTNETEKTRKLLVDKLNGIGFNLIEQQIISPGAFAFLLCNSKMIHIHSLAQLLGEFEGLNLSDPNCVVIGDAADGFSYENLNKVFNLLMQIKPDPVLITMGANKLYQSYGQLFLDCGAYAELLEYSTGIKAKVIGKPAKEYFQLALDHFKMNANETLMVGDDILYDVGGAQEAGIKGGVLVRTGKYRRERDEDHEMVKPYSIVDNLEDLGYSYWLTIPLSDQYLGRIIRSGMKFRNQPSPSSIIMSVLV